MKPWLLLFLCALTLSANELKQEHNFDQALRHAKEQHKKVLMMYSASWCPECTYMKEVVFKNKEVSSYMQTHYVLLVLDTQKDKLPEGFSYPGIPVFFFLDGKAKEQNRITGGSKAKLFLQKLKAVQ